MILWMIRVVAIDIRLNAYLPRWDWVPLQFLLGLGPLIYFYVLKITRPQYKLNRRDLLHFTPLLLEQAALALEVRETLKTGTATWLTHTFQQLNPGLQLLTFVSIIIYLHRSHRLIQIFYRRQQPVLMDRSLLEFRWLRRLLAATALLWLLWIGSAAVDYLGYHDKLSTHIYYPFYILFAVIIIWTATAALLRPQAASTILPPPPVKTSIPPELRTKGLWLKKTIEANHYYQDPELSLSSLAEKLTLPPHELSRIMNTTFQKSFSDLINEYRVREATRLIEDPAYNNLTLLGIAFESGFNSKTTFNRIFKQMTGKSPTEYKNHLKKERPSYNLGRQPRSELLILNREPLQRWVPEKSNSHYMIKSYITIAWRNLIKNKVYAGINVVGLTAGMAVAMLIGLWIWDEVTYDRSFTRHGQLAQVMTNSFSDDGTQSTEPNVCRPIAEELRNKYTNDFKYVSMATWSWRHVLTVGDKIITERGPWVEPEFPVMFSLAMERGYIHALDDPSSILIAASLARTLFGDADPMGKIVRLDDKDNFHVAGVFRDFPSNSTFSDSKYYQAKYFLPWKKYVTMEQWVKDAATDWNGRSWLCFVQVADHIDLDEETTKISSILMAHRSKADGRQTSYLYPMDKWHLYSDFKDGKAAAGPIQFVRLFSVIGIFVLLLACINFMNLSTARSKKRAKEVGIRKTVGSLRSQLISQFLSESLLVAFLSLILSVVLVIVSLPLFNSLAGKQIQLPWLSPLFWLCTLTFTIITGMLSGSYPALYLSNFDPIQVLKGTFRAGRYASLPRKILVVAQFTFSIALIIGTVIVFKQIQFAKNRPVNYRKEGLITVNDCTPNLPDYYDAIRNDLLATGVVHNMAGASDGTNYLGAWRSGFNWTGKNPNTNPVFGFMYVAEDFGKTIGWHLKEGRDFSRDFSTDSTGMILNEAAVKQVGIKNDIVGETIQYDGKNYHVLGVVKDFIQESPYKPVTPTIFLASHSYIGNVSVAIKTAVPVKDALARIAAVFRKYNPALPFSFTFNDEDYARKFEDEERVGKLATFFTVLAVFISCLGLFGLVSFVAEQRKKEIGVRKVLGASVYSLWQMLSKEFAWLVIISCFIAIPLAWLYSDSWLKQYTYRAPLSPWIFVASGMGALAITLITVSFQSIKSALANPVKSLRTE